MRWFSRASSPAPVQGFAAIDIESEAVYLADLPENALAKARAAAPDGLFYLLRVGSSGAFKSSRLTHGANPRNV